MHPTEEEIQAYADMLEEEQAIFYTISGGRRYTANFKINEDGIELIYERYKLVKRS